MTSNISGRTKTMCHWSGYPVKFDISVVLIESTTSKIFLGNFRDTHGFNKLKKLLSETKPLEAVYNNEYLDEEIIKILKTCFFNP